MIAETCSLNKKNYFGSYKNEELLASKCVESSQQELIILALLSMSIHPVFVQEQLLLIHKYTTYVLLTWCKHLSGKYPNTQSE